jgi:hypothetical protein
MWELGVCLSVTSCHGKENRDTYLCFGRLKIPYRNWIQGNLEQEVNPFQLLI